MTGRLSCRWDSARDCMSGWRVSWRRTENTENGKQKIETLKSRQLETGKGDSKSEAFRFVNSQTFSVFPFCIFAFRLFSQGRRWMIGWVIHSAARRTSVRIESVI